MNTSAVANHSLFNRALSAFVAVLLFSGCVSNDVKRINSVQAEHAEQELRQAELIDVNIAVFDPGYVQPVPPESGIFPEVRDAESRFIPAKLRDTLEATGQWGPVRMVAPEVITSELLVNGKVLHSDGETLKISVLAEDASGKVWLQRIYEEEAAGLSYTDADPARNDPFQDLYNRVANDLLKARRKQSDQHLETVRRTAFLRFAQDLAPDAFASYLQEDSKGRYKITGLPANSDPNIQRIQRIRERDYRLIDGIDQYYGVFQDDIQTAYDDWRAASFQEAQALKQVKRDSALRMIAGAAAVAAGIYGAGHAENSAEATAAYSAVMGGGYLFKSGWDKRSETQLHREALKELGESLASEVKPRIIELEGQTVILNGSAEAQYQEWRKLLKQMYKDETGF